MPVVAPAIVLPLIDNPAALACTPIVLPIKALAVTESLLELFPTQTPTSVSLMALPFTVFPLPPSMAMPQPEPNPSCTFCTVFAESVLLVPLQRYMPLPVALEIWLPVKLFPVERSASMPLMHPEMMLLVTDRFCGS